MGNTDKTRMKDIKKKIQKMTKTRKKLFKSSLCMF